MTRGVLTGDESIYCRCTAARVQKGLHQRNVCHSISLFAFCFVISFSLFLVALRVFIFILRVFQLPRYSLIDAWIVLLLSSLNGSYFLRVLLLNIFAEKNLLFEPKRNCFNPNFFLNLLSVSICNKKKLIFVFFASYQFIMMILYVYTIYKLFKQIIIPFQTRRSQSNRTFLSGQMDQILRSNLWKISAWDKLITFGLDKKFSSCSECRSIWLID